MSDTGLPTSFTFRDFVPEQRATWRRTSTGQGDVTNMYVTESLAALVERANRTAIDEGWNVINIETLLMPSAKAVPQSEFPEERPEAEAQVPTTVQVVRLWYRPVVRLSPQETLDESYKSQYDSAKGLVVVQEPTDL